jgi:hypothetical protein
MQDQERSRLIAAVKEADEALIAARGVSPEAWKDAYAKFDAAAAALNEYERNHKREEKARDLWHRAGKLKISSVMVEECKDVNELLAVFARCVVLRAEHDYLTRSFKYVVVSPDLPVLDQNVETPWYTPIVTRHQDGTYTVAFKLGESLYERRERSDV